MTPLQGALPAVGFSATGRGAAASSEVGHGSRGLSFADLFGALASGAYPPLATTPLTNSLPAPEASAADLSALLSELGLEVDTAALQPGPGEEKFGAEQGSLLEGLSLLLSEGRLSVDGSSAAASVPAELRSSGADTALAMTPAVGMESRPGPVEALLATPAGSAASTANALPPGILEALHTLAQASQPPAATEGGSGNALAAALPASAPERSLDAAAGRLPPAPALPPRELQATVSRTFEHVTWMSREGVHEARLQLEPAHLGRVDIRLDVEGSEARLHLGSQQASVREALEAVLPRLRDALAEQGMNLTDASVADPGRDDSSGDAGRRESPGEAAANTDEAGATEHEAAGAHSARSAGLLDAYA